MNDVSEDKRLNEANRSLVKPGLADPGVLLATWFGVGYLPKAPGTWGSLAALPLAWAIVTYGGTLSLLLASLGLFFIGIWASNSYMSLSGSHDPGPVVIDEVVGQWLTLAVVPTELTFYAFGFVLFRLADIFKPWPASWADNKLGGGFGVMADDVLAALYSGGVLYALYRLEVI